MALLDDAIAAFTGGNSPDRLDIKKFLASSLAPQLYAALAGKELYFRTDLLNLILRARDPAAIPLLRQLQALEDWPEAVLAVDGGYELANELIAQLDRLVRGHTPAIAAYYAGARAREALGALWEATDRNDQVAVGIALIGDPADAAWIKALRTTGDGNTAKRIHGALAKPTVNGRLTSLEALAKDMRHLGTVLAMCKLLAEPEPPFTERAAQYLARHVTSGSWTGDAWHATFLRRARTAIAEGVTPAAREALDAIQAKIPNSAPFPQGPPPKKPAQVIASRAAVAEQKRLGAKARGLEMLDTLRESLPVKPASARNPALEAQIAEDPNDAARYLVYADWLQTQNDARGLLITLQHAMTDTAREAAAQAFLDEHRHSLLGRLDPFVRERDLTSVDLDWFMGFIRRARIGGVNAKLLVDAVAALVETPSSMFMQELVVESHGGPLPVDPQRIVDVLLAAGQPQTLTKLVIGKPGAFPLPAALVAAFPGLGRDPVTQWTDAMRGAAEQKKLKADIDPAAVPALVPKQPGVEVDMALVLTGLKAELDKQRPLGVLAAMPQVFARDSLDAFAVALAQQWEALGESPRWPFDALGPLGGERAVEFMRRRLRDWSPARAIQAIDHLVRIGSDTAVFEIIALTLAGFGARRTAAVSALDVVAQRRGLRDRDALILAVCPTTPSERVLDLQRTWLEQLMLAGTRIRASELTRYIANHPVRGPLVKSLLWAECEGERVGRLFRIGEYEPTHAVGLVHPAELEPDTLARLRPTTPQPILQLARPVHWLADRDAKTSKIVAFAKRRVGFYALQNVLERRGWASENDDDMYQTVGWTKYCPRERATACATLDETNGSIAELEVRGQTGKAIAFDKLHVVTISELLWDLETAHGGAAPAEFTKKTPIVVERAKSGRAKCVVCAEPIAKDALRIGVERMIETPQFTGRGMVWIHPACATGVPELAGVDIAALIAQA